MPHYFDTHCHLTLPQSPPLADHLTEAHALGIDHIFDAGLIHSDIEKRLQLLSSPHSSSKPTTNTLPPTSPKILIGGAIAPHSDLDPLKLDNALAQLEFYARTKKIAAIGEIGLEYFHITDPAHHKFQKKLLHEQLLLAKKYHLPVALHLRSSETKSAFRDAYTLLKNIHLTTPIISHCFTGNAAEARLMLKLGAFLSFAGIVTFKKSTHLQIIASQIPLEKMLIETDAPYLAPVPMRGKQNRTAYLLHTQKFIAQLRKMPAHTLAAELVKNACTAYVLPSS
ncbi:TatD family deoxyribonuclease [Spirochaetota bacterium]|nr:TatD family deoxyribonuclease [Spirochaetota bacterium]